jgi:hypothetical protein
MGIKHKFISSKADGGDATIVRPSNWNDDHEINDSGADMTAPSGVANPASPASGYLRLFGRKVFGLMLPFFKTDVGEVIELQKALHQKKVFLVTVASGTTAPNVIGGTLTTAATMSMVQTIASSSPWLATQRKRFQTSTTAGNASGMRTGYVQWYLGSAAGYGGFFFRGRFGHNINLNGGQKFFGLAQGTGALIGDPSALVNMLGVGYDSADASTGNFFFMRNDGSGTATKVDLGAGAARSNTTHGYELIMSAAPNSTNVFVKITNLHTETVLLDTSYNTDVPAVNTGLAFKCEVRNGAVAAADNIESDFVYIESDR